jgi:hypothetical protein
MYYLPLQLLLFQLKRAVVSVTDLRVVFMGLERKAETHKKTHETQTSSKHKVCDEIIPHTALFPMPNYETNCFVKKIEV